MIISLCALFTFVNYGQAWMCPEDSSSVFVRRINETELQFYVDIRKDVEVYKIWSSSNMSLFGVVYMDQNVVANFVNATLCSFLGSAEKGELNIRLKEGNLPGTYRLENSGVLKRCIHVYVLGKPTIPGIFISDRDPKIGENVTVNCSSTSTTTPSNHRIALVYNWKVNNADNPGDQRYSYSNTRTTFTLINVRKEDSNKTFTCTANEDVNNGYASDYSNTVSISVQYGPDNMKFEPPETDYERVESTVLPSITCQVDCNPLCNFRWTRVEDDTHVSTTARLELGIVLRKNIGTYRCTAARPGGTSISKDLTVLVLYAPNVTAAFSAEDRSEGSSISIFCRGAGIPSHYIYTGLTQRVADTEIPNTNKALKGTDVYSSIHFTALQLQDTGNYTCKMNNGVFDRFGRLDQTGLVELLVEVQPKILRSDLTFVGQTGASMIVQVPFYSYPDVSSVQFVKNDGTVIGNNSHFSVWFVKTAVHSTFYGKNVTLDGYLACLMIDNLTKEDVADYTLFTRNSKGTTSVVVSLLAESVPSTPKRFVYVVQDERSLLFIWEKGFNGGHSQTFVIQVSVHDSETWKELAKISEDDERYKVGESYYTASTAGLAPGTYMARIISTNLIGKAEPLRLNASFTIPTIKALSAPAHSYTSATIGSISALIVVLSTAVFVLITLRIRNGPRGCRKDTLSDRDNKKPDEYENSHISGGDENSGLQLSEYGIETTTYEKLQDPSEPRSNTYDSLHPEGAASLASAAQSAGKKQHSKTYANLKMQ